MTVFVKEQNVSALVCVMHRFHFYLYSLYSMRVCFCICFSMCGFFVYVCVFELARVRDHIAVHRVCVSATSPSEIQRA